MDNLINLTHYRSARKRAYLKKYETKLSKLVDNFLANKVRWSFESMSYEYMAHKQRENEEAWDYFDFREVIKEAVDEVFGQEIWGECRSHYWFDERLITKDEMIDRVVSQLVLGPSPLLGRAP